MLYFFLMYCDVYSFSCNIIFLQSYILFTFTKITVLISYTLIHKVSIASIIVFFFVSLFFTFTLFYQRKQFYFICFLSIHFIHNIIREKK